MRAGIGDGIRILCQTFDLPDNVIAFLLVNAKGDLIALIMRLAFLSIPVVVILRLGRLGHNIGAHFVLVANVVVTIIHHDVNAVSACLGGLRHRRERAILRDILDRIQRGIVKIHLAVIGCSLGLGVIRKVGSARGIFAYHLADIKRAFCVLVALLRYDALLVDAVLVIRRVGCKHLVVGGAHIDEAQFAHAILFAGNARDERAPVDVKVALAQGREGQLSGGGHVHHNRLAVILGGDSQRAVNGRGALVVIAGFRTVDVRDCIAEADLCLDITDKVNRVCCCGIVVEAFHSAVRHHQLALLLTGGEVFAFNIAAAHRIGNSSLAVAVRFQAAKDHGILDDRFLRGIARQLDIVEHTAGDLAVLVQLDHSVECAAGDRTISADDILESAACDGAVVIRVDILLEGAVLNDGVLRTNRALCHDAGDGHICKSDLLHGNGLMVGVDGTRSKIHRVAVRGGDVKRRACPSVLFLGGVLPAQALIEVSRHALAAHRHTGHAVQVGLTFTVKVQFCGGAKHHRNQLHGCVVLRWDHVKAGGKRFSVMADADRGNRRAKVCEGVVLGACRQRHGTAAGRDYRPCIAAGVAFHYQLQIVPLTGKVIRLDDIDIPGFIPAVQGAVFRQQQLVCLLLRSGAQAGDIAEKAAPDIAAVLGQLIVGAAVNGAQIQLHIGVAAAQNVDAVHIVGVDTEFARDHAIQQIHSNTGGIADGHIAADRAVQNVLYICIFNAGDGQSGSFVKAPAGTGRCLGQTVRTGLDLDHLIFCFRVRTNILILVFRAVSDAVGLFRRRGRKPCPCICKCGYRENGEHHTECQYHAHDAFFHDILSFVG